MIQNGSRVVLGLEYDGRGFNGWQVQPDKYSIQSEFERALTKVAGNKKISIVCAGRTDAGVHATGQVVHFDPVVKREPSNWVTGCNAFLNGNMAVNWARVVGKEFHARYSAKSRTYAYFILNRQQPPGLLKGKVGWCKEKLSLLAIKEGCRHLVGMHDFSAFRAAGCQAANANREIFSINVTQYNDLIKIELTANAFLQHMVRNIVGSLLQVGIGKKPPIWIAEVRDSRNRTLGGPTFSSDGLFLTKVSYDECWAFPSDCNSDGLYEYKY